MAGAAAAGGNGNSHSNSSSLSGLSSSTTTSTACAACKYQRRKCSRDCPLSPYFPADQPKRFANVHKLFGVSNILRILKHVDPAKREDTVKAIAYEADTREKDPVHGCLGVITVLQNQVAKLREELQAAREQLLLMEQQQQQALATQPSVNPFHGHGAFDEDAAAQFLSDPKLSLVPPLDFARYDPGGGGGEQQQQPLRRTGSYFDHPSYDDSPVSHHQMHTMAALDHDPSFHLRSYGFHFPDGGADGGADGKQRQGQSFLLGSNHVTDLELRRAGVYLSLTNHH